MFSKLLMVACFGMAAATNNTSEPNESAAEAVTRKGSACASGCSTIKAAMSLEVPLPTDITATSAATLARDAVAESIKAQAGNSSAVGTANVKIDWVELCKAVSGGTALTDCTKTHTPTYDYVRRLASAKMKLSFAYTVTVPAAQAAAVTAASAALTSGTAGKTAFFDAFVNAVKRNPKVYSAAYETALNNAKQAVIDSTSKEELPAPKKSAAYQYGAVGAAIAAVVALAF